MSKHAVPPGVPVHHNILWRPATWRGRRCKVLRTRVAHRSGQNSSWTPATAAAGTQGSITCFFAGNHSCAYCCCKAPYCTAHPRVSASICHQGSHNRDLLDKPRTASAAEASATYVQADSEKIPTTAAAPLVVTPLAAFLECGCKTSNH